MKKITNIFLITMVLSGCATYYPVRINGYLDKTQTTMLVPAGASFFVLENKNEKNPFLDVEIKSKIETLLGEKGYKIESCDKADFYLSFTYAISSGITVSEVQPFYNIGETGTIQTITPAGKVITSIVTFPGYTTYVPYKEIVYTSYLLLDVLDADSLRNKNEKKVLWVGENSTTIENPDLRETINYLLAGAFQYFGENTGKSIIKKVSRKDPLVKKILP